MKLKPLPPQSRIRELLDYDPSTGIFIWRRRPLRRDGRWNGKWAGKIAGTHGEKGIVIYVDSIAYSAHRLAWVYCNGDCLDDRTLIDHRNCNPHDNRIKNLRPATHGQNCSNSRQRKHKALPKGVSTMSRGTYRARIGIDGIVKTLGSFTTPEAAHAAYLAAAQEAKGEFARGR